MASNSTSLTVNAFPYYSLFILLMKLSNYASFIQCGQGSTSDLLRPTCISSLSGIQVLAVAAGLWHTVCIAGDGQVYTFGGNQFGQLGTGAEQAEVCLNAVTYFTLVIYCKG